MEPSLRRLMPLHMLKGRLQCCPKITSISQEFDWMRTRRHENNENPNPHPNPRQCRIVFPGAGLFFYWQAGAVQYLREAGYDLSKVSMSGASAGAITATLAATRVDFNHATDVALRLGRDAGVWSRPLGLLGIWGDLIEQWLDEILPADAEVLANENNLSILLTSLPTLGKQRVSNFSDRNDLIRANIATIHLPLFLDGRFASRYRDSLHIDGSFLSSPKDHFPSVQPAHDDSFLLVLDFEHDPLLKGKKKDFVRLASEDSIFCNGMFESLPRNTCKMV